jgi:hypothetical protein
MQKIRIHPCYREFCALQSDKPNMLWISAEHPQHIVAGQHRPTWKCSIGIFTDLTRLARGKAISRQTRQSRHCWALWGMAALGRKLPSLCCSEK